MDAAAKAAIESGNAMLILVVGLVGGVWFAFWFVDKALFYLKMSKRTPEGNLKRVADGLEESLRLQRDLVTGVHALSHIQEQWFSQREEYSDRADRDRRSLRTGQRDLDGKLDELKHRVGKLACSKANGDIG